MRSISFEQADPILTWHAVAEALRQGHQLSKAQTGDLLLQSQPNSLLNRGAWIDGLGMALKSMSIFPDNAPLPSIQGGVLLFDETNGAIKAFIDGILVTKWKTAGDSVLGAKLLANPDPKTHLMIGAGTVAASLIEAYAEIFPSINKFLIWNRTPQNAERLCQELGHKLKGLEIIENLEEACGQADIISSATMSKTPIIKGDWIQPGTHVDLIGAFRPDMREADDELLKKGEIFVDSRETTIGHIGEIEIPLKSGIISVDDIIGDFYELTAKIKSRSSSKAITIFKNGGGAHLDLMVANLIFKSIPKF